MAIICFDISVLLGDCWICHWINIFYGLFSNIDIRHTPLLLKGFASKWSPCNSNRTFMSILGNCSASEKALSLFERSSNINYHYCTVHNPSKCRENYDCSIFLNRNRIQRMVASRRARYSMLG